MSSLRVLITDGMAEAGIKVLQDSGLFDVDLREAVSAEELPQALKGAHVVVIRSATQMTREAIEAGPDLKLIVRAGAGVDNIDVPFATERGLPVMNTASANSLAAAEQTIALMFSMLRSIPQAAASLSQNKWDRKSFKGYEVTGKTVGVIGLGAIGRMVARKAWGLEAKVIGFDPFIKSRADLPEPLKSLPEPEMQLATDMDQVLKAADILTVHVPKIPATQHMIHSEALSKMKDGSWFINCARGGIVDEAAVIQAVDSGKLRGAAFDVFEKEPPAFPSPLVDHPKIVTVPHLGASTVEAQHRVALTASEQMIGFFKNEDLTGVINRK